MARAEPIGVIPGTLAGVEVRQQKAGEGDGTLLQYSCLENPMDGGAW